jgi:hypothetical protein
MRSRSRSKGKSGLAADAAVNAYLKLSQDAKGAKDGNARRRRRQSPNGVLGARGKADEDPIGKEADLPINQSSFGNVLRKVGAVRGKKKAGGLDREFLTQAMQAYPQETKTSVNSKLAVIDIC